MATLNSLSVGSEFHVFESGQEANVSCVGSGMGHFVPSLGLEAPSVALQAMTRSVHSGAVDSSNTNTKRQKKRRRENSRRKKLFLNLTEVGQHWKDREKLEDDLETLKVQKCLTSRGVPIRIFTDI